MPTPFESLQISVAIVISGQRILLSQRPAGTHLEGMWEFPGGKVKAGETPEAAVKREAAEELGIDLQGLTLLDRQEFEYPDRKVEILFYLTRTFAGEPTGREGQELRWVPASELSSLQTPPANKKVIRALVEQFS
jgi:8-oxo-dGTP diphosphatase